MNDLVNDEQMEDEEAALVGPQQPATATGDDSASTPKIAFDFCAYQIESDSSSDELSRDQPPAEHAIPDFSGQRSKVEVSIPALPLQITQHYEEPRSDVVERVCSLDMSAGGDGELVEVEFTDGTVRKVSSTVFYRLSFFFSLKILSLSRSSILKVVQLRTAAPDDELLPSFFPFHSLCSCDDYPSRCLGSPSTHLTFVALSLYYRSPHPLLG